MSAEIQKIVSVDSITHRVAPVVCGTIEHSRARQSHAKLTHGLHARGTSRFVFLNTSFVGNLLIGERIRIFEHYGLPIAAGMLIAERPLPQFKPAEVILKPIHLIL
jgi:hypothetical protein